MTPDDPRHGTYAGGRTHRTAGQQPCEPCRRAEARYEQARQLDILNGRPRSLPALGTMRRLQALAALGHTFMRMADALSMTQAGAHHLATRNRGYVRATTAAKVDALYEAWSMTLPSEATTRERKAATYARGVARKHGWAPPLAWDDIDTDHRPLRPAGARRSVVDDAVVLRILGGDWHLAATATPDERTAVTTGWTRSGRSLNDLERLTGWRADRYTDNQGDTAA